MMILKHIGIIWLFLLQHVQSIGMSIPPISQDDKDHYSGLNYLDNCLSYHTNNNDLIMVTVLLGERLPSQSLNLKVFDSEDNLLRYSNNIMGEINLILKNLNNPDYYLSEGSRDVGEPEASLKPTPSKIPNKRDQLLDKLPGFHPSRSNDAKLNELLNNDKGKNLIYVCFDNIYSDKSWSFQPQIKDIDLHVNLRDVSTLKETNYNLYSKYFNKFRSSIQSDTPSLLMEEKDFDEQIEVIENEIHNVVQNLKNSELILQNLLDQEWKLRDVNEKIFAGYTRISIILLVTILVMGLFQIAYFGFYFKRRFS